MTDRRARLRIATRKSPLALAQARYVAARIRAHAPDLEIEEVQIVTEGDRVLVMPLAMVGGKGLFVSEVEAAIADGRADLAVHSVKDVPEALAPGMALVCVPEREDPRDVLVTRDGAGLFDLPAGARVGTSSLRRAVQLHAARSDLAFGVLRGNVGTRLSRLAEGRFDAIVLARAGLVRLELLEEQRCVTLDAELSTPAVGQGALGLEARADDERVRALVAPLEHAATRVAVECERAVLVRLHGSCSTPLAAHARYADGGITLDAMVGSLDGARVLRAGSYEATRPEAALATARRVGDAVADQLLASGAGELIAAARATSDPYAQLFASSASVL